MERKLYDPGRTVKIFIFALLFRASKSFMKAFINSFAAPKRSMKKKYFKLNFYFNTTFSEMYGAGRMKVFEKRGMYL